MARAVRLCPALVIVPPDFSAIQGGVEPLSSLIFREVTTLIEPLSLDGTYLDVTENAWGEDSPRTSRGVSKRASARKRG